MLCKTKHVFVAFTKAIFIWPLQVCNALAGDSQNMDTAMPPMPCKNTWGAFTLALMHMSNGGGGPNQWLNALNLRDNAIATSCPANLPTLVKRPLSGSSLMTGHLKAIHLRLSTLEDQMNWGLTHTIVPPQTTLHFEHDPRTPGNDVLSSQIVRGPFPSLNNTYVHQLQCIVAKRHHAH